jgi:ribosomal protein L16 Arg81 hydroxylase
MSRERFLAEYWNTSFLRLEGEKGRFSTLLTWPDLNSILASRSLQPRQLRLVQSGKTIESVKYRTQSPGGGSLDSGALTACLARGATLVLNNIDTLADPIAALCRSLEDALQAVVTTNLYASWQTENGFDLHWDDQDTMILQVAGRKQWQVYGPTRIHPLRTDPVDPPKPQSEPIWSGVLADGDMIYLPRGWWHMAHPMAEPSLHLTVTIVPPNGVNFLKWLIDDLQSQALIRSNIPLPGPAQESYFKELRQMLAESLDKQAPLRFLRAQTGHRNIQSSLQLPASVYRQLAPLTANSYIRLSGSRKLAWLGEGTAEADSFMAGGTLWSCPKSIKLALESLSSETSSNVGELRNTLGDAASGKALMRLLTALATAGVVLVDP